MSGSLAISSHRKKRLDSLSQLRQLSIQLFCVLKLCLLPRCVRRRGSCCSARVSAAERSTWPASLWPRPRKGSLSVPSANQVLLSKALKVIGSVIPMRHSIVV